MDRSTPAVTVVLPTYNEAQSLRVIVPRICRTLREAGITHEVIVVDDASPDGTADVARELAAQWPVRVQKRLGERGLATAALAGFRMSEAPVCVVMDADGSHPVEALPQMVQMILADKTDIVVGSRHVAGGGSRNWPVFSQLKSKLAAALAFGVTNLTDPTAGFMALRRSLLPPLSLDPVGWKIVLEIAVKAAPVRVVEVPIVFTDRELGSSKQSLRVFVQYLAHLRKLYAFRYPSLSEFARFCLVGALGMLVDLATVAWLKEAFALDTRLCAVAGFAVAVTSNFALNRRYTFSRARQLPWLFSYVTYLGANLAGLAVRVLTVTGLIAVADLDRGRGYLLTNFIGIVFATLVNFVGAKFFAFAPERLSASTSASDAPRAWPTTRRARRLSGAVLLACAGYAFATTVPHPPLRAPYERVNVTMARNIRSSRALLVRPSVHPGGHEDWVAEDLPKLGNLPAYPALLAAADAALGVSGMALLSLCALLLTVACTARLLALADPGAGWFVALLMAGSPALHLAFRQVAFEPALTGVCALGLYAFVRGAEQRRLLWCFAGGAGVGLGFLTKLWLIVPYAFAACGFAVALAASVVRSGSSAGLRRSALACVLGFVGTAAAHLAFVAIVAPADLPRWISSVYLGIFSGEGVTGGKLSGAAGYAQAQKSALYYGAVLYRDHFYLLPLSLAGLGELLASTTLPVTRRLVMIAFALAAVVALSVPAVKQPAYVLAVTPFLYALAGLSLSALAQSPEKHAPSNRALARLAVFIAFGSCAAVTLARVVAPARVPSGYVAAHVAGMVLAAGALELWRRGKPLQLSVAALVAVGLAGLGAIESLR